MNTKHHTPNLILAIAAFLIPQLAAQAQDNNLFPYNDPLASDLFTTATTSGTGPIFTTGTDFYGDPGLFSSVGQFSTSNDGSSSKSGSSSQPGRGGPSGTVLLTPAMTGNSAPAPYVASASSTWGNTLAVAPCAAFNQKQTDPVMGDCYASANNTYDSFGNGNEWIMIDLGSPKMLVSYVLRARGSDNVSNANSTFPSVFTLSVSTDGVNFTNIETHSNLPAVTALYQPFSFTLVTPVQARYIKWTITKINYTQGIKHVAIGEIELYGYEDSPSATGDCLWTESGSNIHFSTGNVGIGTTNPTHKLSVSGTIRAKEIIVDTGWADHVFEADYQIPSLEAVEQHIKRNKHLPGIPTAQEIAAKGVSLGEMQSLLLAKIEELTLHQIELNKRLRALEQENAALKAAVISPEKSQEAQK